jgi:TonB family protein
MKFLLLLSIIVVLSFNSSFCQIKPVKKVDKPKHSQNKEVYYHINGIKHGPYSFYYNGKKQVEGAYINNLKSGEWKYFDSEGNIRIIGHYENDKQIGIWLYYDKNRLISKLIFDPNQTIDTLYGFWPNGNIVQRLIIDRNKKVSYKTTYYEDNIMSEKSTLVSGEYDGIFERFDKKGDLAIKLEFKNGCIYNILQSTEDLSLLLTFSGNISNGNGSVLINRLDSTTLTFKPYIEFNHKNGLRNGTFIKYFENGSISAKGSYKNNYLDGTFTFYKKNGNVELSKTYQIADSLKSDESIGIIYNSSLLNSDLEILPKFLGGDLNSFRAFINNSLRYPEKAAEKGMQGRVIISFYVNIIGALENIIVINSVDKELDREALRVVKLSPFWEPGFQLGIPVKVSFNIPIIFSLM